MGKYYKYKNLEENRFQEFDKSDILSGPLHIAIDITNKCNENVCIVLIGVGTDCCVTRFQTEKC